MSDKTVLPENWPKAVHIHELLALARKGKSIIVPAVGTRSYTLDSGHKLTTQEFAVDFEDPAACTEIRLLQLKNASPTGHYFINPQFTVSTAEDGTAFCIAAEAASCRWFKQLDRLYPKSVRRAMFKQAKRQLHFRRSRGEGNQVLEEGP